MVLFLLGALSFSLQAQDCNCALGSNTLTVPNGTDTIVNAYYRAAASALEGSTSISLGAEQAAGVNGTIAVGDVVMIIQMQGAEINTTRPDFTGSDYGDGPGGNDASGFLKTEDYVAGLYEYCIATSAVGLVGGTLTLQSALINSYLHEIDTTQFTDTQGRQTFQVVKVGNFTTVDVQAGGSITGLPWNGTSGGVIAIDALTSLTIDGDINADYLGFRGGLRRLADNDGDTNDNTSTTAGQPAMRGEGIAGTPWQVYAYNDAPLLGGTLTETVLSITGYAAPNDTVFITNVFPANPNLAEYTSSRGSGAPGNAGGAGRFDGSGGGGSNGAFGGKGGWPPDRGQEDNSGRGGDSLSIEGAVRAFLGGGGGSGGWDNDGGHTVDAASGQPGGGIIVIRANSMSGSGTIRTTGETGGSQTSEGAGGGGAGGTVIILTDTEDLSGLTLTAAGGDGGATAAGSDAGGGGGSGGNILIIRRGGEVFPAPTVDVSGGLAGGGGGGSFPGDAGSGGFQTTSDPPPINLDCPLINLPTASPGGVIDDLRLWFTAGTDVTYDGSGDVTAWVDQSANGFNATNAALGTGSTPDFTSSSTLFNGNPYVSFNEGADLDEYLGFTTFNNFPTDSLSMFLVMNTTNSSGTRTALSYYDGTQNDYNLDLVATSGLSRQSISGNTNDGISDVTDGFTHIIQTTYLNNGAGNDDAKIYVENAIEPDVSTFNAGPLTQGGDFALGQDIDVLGSGGFQTAQAYQGKIAEVILYFNDELTNTERAKVSSYLAIKYGVTLDQTSAQDYINSIGQATFPAASEPATYGGYDNDIAGIGRDDGSGLSQTQSKSINTNTKLTGSVSSFASDRQFAVWGNDAGNLDFSTTEIPSGVTERLDREWRVAVLNGLEDVDLSFDLSSGVTNVPPSTDNLVLMIDDDGDFSNGITSQVAVTSWDGSTATFSDVDFSDDDVFTIGVVPDSPGGVDNTLTIWVKADAGTSTTVDGAEVDTWTDQSSNAYNLTSNELTGSGGDGPTYQQAAAGFNFNPHIDFNSASQVESLGISGFTFPANQFTAFNILNISNTGNEHLYTYISGTTDQLTLHDFDALKIELQNTDRTPNNNIANGVTRLLTYDVNTATTSTNVFVDGLANSGNSYTAPAGAFLTSGTFVIGQEADNETDGGFDANAEFIGDMAEITIYDGVLTAAERQRVESYLAIKYGLTLDQSTGQDYLASNGLVIFPATSSLPDYETFANDIAGIGRDDVSDMEQLQSKSINSDAIVTMSMSTFANNNQFLVWGNDNDDNGVIAEVSIDIPNNVATRLDREWRVANTGNVEDVAISFDISGLTLTGTTASDFMLMIDQNGDFTDGFVETIVADSLSGNVAYFNNIDFTDDYIFTLGTSRPAIGPGGVTTGLEMWLRGDRGVTLSGSDVTAWADQSIQGNDATPASGNAQISSSSLNGNDALDFGNDVYSTTLTLDPNATNMSIFVVDQPDAAQNSSVLGQVSGGQSLFEHETGGEISSMVGSTTVQTTATASVEDAEILGYTLTGSTVQWYVNGATDDNESAGTITSSTGAWQVGSDNTGTSLFLDGLLGDVIVHSQALTGTDLAKVQSYLAIKYGITPNGGDYDLLSAAGTIVFPGNSDADFASYRTDLGIIGRDDLSDLEQLSSSSVNSSSVLSISNDNPFTADDQFFSWAHNGLTMESGETSDVPPGIESRLNRIWKVKKINNPDGTVDLTFNFFSQGPLAPGDLRLLVDADGTFSNATILSPTVSQSGYDYTFQNVDLSSFPDEYFFTVASIDNAGSPLPLEWLSIVAEFDGNQVSLKWVTANEIEVSHFEIEKSLDGLVFETIAIAPAANTLGINAYQYLDPQLTGQLIYYRVRQVDFDGQNDLSDLVFALANMSDTEITVFPNPVVDQLNIRSSLPLTGSGMVIDISGKAIHQFSLDGERTKTINMSGLQRGIYHIRINTATGSSSMKVIKN